MDVPHLLRGSKMPPESMTVTDLCELLWHEARCLPLEIEGHLGRDLAQAWII